MSRPASLRLFMWLAACMLGAPAAPCHAAEEAAAVASPVSPRESLKHIVVDAGLRVELAAHEPQVTEPVAIRFDEQGRMWVVEMGDYPTGEVGDPVGGSRITILEDRDGDGLFETSTLFADKLRFATGVQPWKGGAFVTMAGQLAYLKDEDGDGRADAGQTWYFGFAELNTQLRANDPRLALDNRIYVANGLRGGKITSVHQPAAPPLSLSGMDFRFNPLSKEAEATSGDCQFGMGFDDYGNRFICTNRNPCLHVVMDNRDLAKNPLFAAPAVSTNVAKAGAESKVFPIARAWTTSNLHAGQFTACCGVKIYRGDALPPAYYGNAFTCDPTGHLVHREIVRPEGVSFVATPADEGREFFASRDEWSNPVNLEIGPDGALYVVDMYRAVIEHPEWMPEELRTRRDMNLGRDMGRIYRVVAANKAAPRPKPSLASASISQLVEGLADSNAWRRETCARLLLERQDSSALEPLKQTARHGASPLARIHALWLLRALGGLDDQLLLSALGSEDPRVVEEAIDVANDRDEMSKAIRERIAALRDAADDRVRFRATLAVAPNMPKLARPADKWQEYAVLVAAGDRGGDALAETLADAAALAKNSAKPELFVVQLAKLAAASRNAVQHQRTVEALLSSDRYRMSGLTSFLAAVVAAKGSVADVQDHFNESTRQSLQRVFDEAKATAVNESRPEERRTEAIDLVALSGAAADVLTPIALKSASAPIRQRAVAALVRVDALEPWRRLTANFSSETLGVQGAILDGLLARPERVAVLLDEVAAGRIKPASIGLARLPRLTEHADKAISERAKMLLAAAIPADRQQALADYQAALALTGDPAAGRKVFEKSCASCHRVGEVGIAFAPDISDSREKTPIQILTDIIQPNRAVDSNFFSFTALTVDGLTHAGILVAETPTSVTLKQAEGKQISLLRDDLDVLESTGLSQMPEGLEKDISHQQMADLIAFIKNWRYLDGRVPLSSK